MAQKCKLTHTELYNELVVKLVEDQLIKRDNNITKHIHLYLQFTIIEYLAHLRKKLLL